jgi:hypothetical protein
MEKPTNENSALPASPDAGAKSGVTEGTGSRKRGWPTPAVILALVAVAVLAGAYGYHLGSRSVSHLVSEHAKLKKRVADAEQLMKPRVAIAGQGLAIELLNGTPPYSLEVRIGDGAPILSQTTKPRCKVPLKAVPASGVSIHVTATDATGQRATAKLKAPY